MAKGLIREEFHEQHQFLEDKEMKKKAIAKTSLLVFISVFVISLALSITSSFSMNGGDGDPSVWMNATSVQECLERGVASCILSALQASDDTREALLWTKDADTRLNTTHNNYTIPPSATIDSVQVCFEGYSDDGLGDDVDDLCGVFVGENSTGTTNWYALSGPDLTTCGANGLNGNGGTGADKTNCWDASSYLNTRDKANNGLISIYIRDDNSPNKQTDIDYLYIEVNYTPDTTEPFVSIILPENTTYNTTTRDLNYSASDTNLDRVWYNYNGANTTLTGNTTFTALDDQTSTLTLYANDSAGNENSTNVTFTVDTTKPIPTLNAPIDYFNTTAQNITFNFTVTDNLATSLNCSLYINSTLNQTNSTTTNNTLTNFNVTNIAEGTYWWNVTCLDKALNFNTSSNRTFTVDISSPTVNVITLNPGSADDIDPDVTINVTANVSDAVAVDTVIFQYKQDSAVTWNNDTMDYNSGTGLYENASFTPNVPGTWNYRIWSNDTLENAGINTQTNLSVEYDYTWTISPASFGVVSGIITATSDVGVLTINNTGDYTLNFDLSSDWTNTFYNVTEPFDLAAKNVTYINITATFSDTTREDLITITIDATSANADPSYSTINATIASYAGGPYFDVSIITYSAAVTQSQSGINLRAKLKNIGNETATNTWLNWTLPTGWTNSSGNITQNISNLTAGSLAWNNLTITINATTASAGTVTIIVNASSAQNITDSDSKSVIVSCNNTDGVCGAGCTVATDTDCQVTTTTTAAPSVGRGGAGPSAAPTVTPEEKAMLLQTEETLELVRGLNDTFPLKVTNPFEDSKLRNVTLSVTGFLAQYVTVTPDMIYEIPYPETRQFEVLITAPAYMEKGEHALNFTISSRMIMGAIERDVIEYRLVTLAVHEVSGTEANVTLESALQALKDMLDAGFSATNVEKLLSQATGDFALSDYESAKELAEQIIGIKDTAFATHDLIQDVKGKIKDAEDRGLQTSETKSLLNMAIAAFEREDYVLAQRRAKDAQLVYAIETTGKVNYVKLLIDYWYVVLSVAAAASIAGLLLYRRLIVVIIARRLEDLTTEEININELIKEAQRQTYVEKTMTSGEYHKALAGYEKRLAEIKNTRAKLRAKRVGIIKISKELDNLKKEDATVLELMKTAQRNYFEKKTITKAKYERAMDAYKLRRTEIESNIAVLEAKLAKKMKLEELGIGYRIRAKKVAKKVARKVKVKKPTALTKLIEKIKNMVKQWKERKEKIKKEKAKVKEKIEKKPKRKPKPKLLKRLTEGINERIKAWKKKRKPRRKKEIKAVEKVKPKKKRKPVKIFLGEIAENIRNRLDETQKNLVEKIEEIGARIKKAEKEIPTKEKLEKIKKVIEEAEIKAPKLKEVEEVIEDIETEELEVSAEKISRKEKLQIALAPLAKRMREIDSRIDEKFIEWSEEIEQRQRKRREEATRRRVFSRKQKYDYSKKIGKVSLRKRIAQKIKMTIGKLKFKIS